MLRVFGGRIMRHLAIVIGTATEGKILEVSYW